jgi:alpha-beta hydrolase superfamily lysophospholipase
LSAEEIDTFTSTDGYEHKYRRFRAHSPRATIVFVHGIQSHGGWYIRSCRQLAEAGYEVYFLDRRGAGLNTAARGDTRSFRRLLDDIHDFVAHIPKSGSKLFLAGISWGGKLALGFPYRYPNKIDGMLLLCPGFFPQVRPPFFQRLWIGRCRLRCPTRLFPVPLSDAELFTENKDWQKFIAEDPLATRLATARFLVESFNLDFYVKRAVKRVTMPIVLLLAEKERVIFNEKTRKWIERKAPTPDKTILEYPGASHTLEFEPADHPYVKDMIAWLDKRSL